MSVGNPMRRYRRYKGNKKTTGKRLLTAVFILLLLGILVFFSLFGIVMDGSRDEINGQPQIMIILGCQVMPAGHPSVLLRDRLDKALTYLNDHPGMTVVVAGGQGGGEPTTEAFAMAEYLINNGIPEESILQESYSFSTWENLCFSAELLAENGYDITSDIVVVSNGFHLARVRMLWSRMSGGQKNLSTLAAPSSHVPSRLRMYVREPLALIKSFLVDWG